MKLRRSLIGLAAIAVWHPLYLFCQAGPAPQPGQSAQRPGIPEEITAAPANRAEAMKTAAAKRTPLRTDGHPDLSGNWFFRPTLVGVKEGSSILFGLDRDGIATPQRLRADDPTAPPYKPELFDKIYQLTVKQTKMDPAFVCKPPGIPRIGPPHQIIQSDNLIVFLYSDLSGSFYRVIPTDGRAHNPDADETYLGDSIGRWDKDTLVVDVTSFNEDTWLGDDGLIHSNKLHVIEKLRRVGDTVEYQATVEDPEVLRKPWEMMPRTLLLTNEIITEAAPCREMDGPHLVNDRYHGNTR